MSVIPKPGNADVEQQTKTCTKCETTRDIDQFRLRKLKSGNGYYHQAVCRVCERLVAQQYRLDNPQKTKDALANWKRNNPAKNAAHSRKSWANRRDKCRQTTLRWISANRERYLAWLRNYGRRSSELLTDTYVAHTIRMPIAQAPKMLIELKRAKIEIHRSTKKLISIIKEKQK